MVTIKKYHQGIEEELFKVFSNAILMSCNKDYTKDQLKAWVPEKYDPEMWCQRIQDIEPFVAYLNDKVVGYADIQEDGYIDHFFVHSAYQRKGVGSALMSTLLSSRPALEKLYSHVSITAKPFFEHYGFNVVRENMVSINDQQLKNYIMEKRV